MTDTKVKPKPKKQDKEPPKVAHLYWHPREIGILSLCGTKQATSTRLRYDLPVCVVCDAVREQYRREGRHV